MNNFRDKCLLKSVWIAKIDHKFISLHRFIWHKLISKVLGHLFITLVDYHLPYQHSWMVAMWEARWSCRLCRQLCSSWQWLLNTDFAGLLLSFVNAVSFHCARGFFLADVFLHISGIFLFCLLLLTAEHRYQCSCLWISKAPLWCSLHYKPCCVLLYCWKRVLVYGIMFPNGKDREEDNTTISFDVIGQAYTQTAV